MTTLTVQKNSQFTKLIGLDVNCKFTQKDQMHSHIHRAAYLIIKTELNSTGNRSYIREKLIVKKYNLHKMTANRIQQVKTPYMFILA